MNVDLSLLVIAFLSPDLILAFTQPGLQTKLFLARAAPILLFLLTLFGLL